MTREELENEMLIKIVEFQKGKNDKVIYLTDIENIFQTKEKINYYPNKKRGLYFRMEVQENRDKIQTPLEDLKEENCFEIYDTDFKTKGYGLRLKKIAHKKYEKLMRLKNLMQEAEEILKNKDFNFDEARKELSLANSHLEEKRLNDAATNFGKCFESVLKAIFNKRGILYNQNKKRKDNLGDLIRIATKNGLIENDNMFLGINAFRNPASHGGGKLNQNEVVYMKKITEAAIVFLLNKIQ